MKDELASMLVVCERVLLREATASGRGTSGSFGIIVSLWWDASEVDFSRFDCWLSPAAVAALVAAKARGSGAEAES